MRGGRPAAGQAAPGRAFTLAVGPDGRILGAGPALRVLGYAIVVSGAGPRLGLHPMVELDY